MKSNTRLKPHTEAGPKIAENEKVELFKKEIGNRDKSTSQLFEHINMKNSLDSNLQIYFPLELVLENKISSKKSNREREKSNKQF